MDGISRQARVRTASFVALVAAGVVLTGVLSGPASSARATCILIFCNKDVSFGVRNSSQTPVHVEICPKGHANDPGDTHNGPCNVVTESFSLGPGQAKTIFNTNPLGVMIRPSAPGGGPWKNTTLLLYVSNPLVGKPYIRAQGHKVELAENEAPVRDAAGGVNIELRRYGDEDRNGDSVKIMRVEIRKWPAK
jgi:hypothetical protein